MFKRRMWCRTMRRPLIFLSEIAKGPVTRSYERYLYSQNIIYFLHWTCDTNWLGLVDNCCSAMIQRISIHVWNTCTTIRCHLSEGPERQKSTFRERMMFSRSFKRNPEEYLIGPVVQNYENVRIKKVNSLDHTNVLCTLIFCTESPIETCELLLGIPLPGWIRNCRYATIQWIPNRSICKLGKVIVSFGELFTFRYCGTKWNISYFGLSFGKLVPVVMEVLALSRKCIFFIKVFWPRWDLSLHFEEIFSVIRSCTVTQEGG